MAMPAARPAGSALGRILGGVEVGGSNPAVLPTKSIGQIELRPPYNSVVFVLLRRYCGIARDRLERSKAQIRAKGEHAFRVVKRKRQLNHTFI